MLGFSKGVLIQVKDPKSRAWITVCPITSILNDNEDRRHEASVFYTQAHHEALAEHLKAEETFYVVSSLQSAKFETFEGAYFLLADVSLHLRFPACLHTQELPTESEASLKAFLKAKNTCVLTPYVDELVRKFGQFSPFHSVDKRVSAILKDYDRLSERLEK